MDFSAVFEIRAVFESIRQHISLVWAENVAWSGVDKRLAGYWKDLPPEAMLKILQNNPPCHCTSWSLLEADLRRLSQTIPGACTCYNYAVGLHTIKILPALSNAVIRAVQLGLRREWPPEGTIGDSWVSCPLNQDQHNDWTDWAAASSGGKDERTERPKSLFAVYEAVVQCAVADD